MTTEEMEGGNWTGAITDSERPEWLVIMDHASTIILTCNTITLMLGIGAATYWREMWQHLKRPWGCLIGLVCQFVILPAVGFGLIMALHLPPYQSLGVLILTCSPGGAFSNFFTYWAGGDLALSIMMTAISSLLAFGAMPLNLWLYTQPWTDQELLVPYYKVLTSLAFVTAPAILGMIIRNYNRRWATYISKVCGLLGWVGALTCGVMLILMYWDVILNTSLFLVVAAALVPIAGFIFAYILAKIVCLSHKICRTVAIETSCQNMVVATNVMLLSFEAAEIRGQLVIFPVLYGLCQLGQMIVGIGIFQLWAFVHRDDVTEEEIGSVLDNTILTSVPVPAHKLSQARMQSMTGNPRTPDICRMMEQQRQEQDSQVAYFKSRHKNRYHLDFGEHSENERILRSTSESDCDMWTTPRQIFSPRPPSPTPGQHSELCGPCDLPQEKFSQPLNSPEVFKFPSSPYFGSERPRLESYRSFLDEEVFSEDSELPNSPTLSNKGVPNMFPVTEKDFLPSEERVEELPLPYGSPIPASSRNWLKEEDITRRHPTDGSESPEPWSPSPSAPKSPSGESRTFAFYHDDIRIGQTQQFSTFGRKK